MCNDYRLELGIAAIAEDFDDLEINIDAPEGMPNVEARQGIKITDTAPLVRSVWSGTTGKPVYNYVSDGRSFPSHRCLILADGFYEFTAPEDPKQKRKDKWLFTLRDHRWFCIAGIWRRLDDGSEAFTMLTIPAGEDVKPYHPKRQIVPLPRDRWADWLDARVPAHDVLDALPKGSLEVERVYPPRTEGALL